MNPDVFNRIYDETFDDLARFIAVKCHDVAEIPDLLQETYTDFYRYLLKHGAEHVRHPRGLLFKIAKRKLFRHYALKAKMKHVLSLDQPGDEGGDTLQNDRRLAVEPVDVETRWVYERWLAMIAEYPADVRKIYHLYYYEDMKLREIADVMGLSVSNVKNKLYRTRHELRTRWEEEVSDA